MKVLRRIWRSPITTAVLGVLFVLSFLSAIYYHVNVFTAGVVVLSNIPVNTVTIPETGNIVGEVPGNVVTVPTAEMVQGQNVWLPQATKLLEENEGRLTQIYQRVYTTKLATSVIFEGLGSVEEAQRVISALRANTGLGTFFVTREQLATEIRTIEVLIRAGEQMGILVDPGVMGSTELMCNLLESIDILRNTYGYAGAIVLRPVLGIATEALLECGSALGCAVVSHTFQAVPETVWQKGNVETIAELVFTESMPSLQRGGIALFEMGVFSRDEVLGDYVRHVIGTRNPYPVVPVTDVIMDTGVQYIYPLPERMILDTVRNAVYPGHTTYANVMQKIANGYIGLAEQNKDTLMPGFTYLERESMNTKGLVRNEDEQVFLTFQGWGSDTAVEAILAVLEKHNAHATFFLQTELAAANPNLVRGIAADGHDIGTMTHTGQPLAIGLDSDTRFVEINATESDALREDVLLSYDTLMHICGDMTSNSGKPSLTSYLRPPNLAVSRRGLEVVMDLGITYCVLGSYDCEDDEAKRAMDLANEMRKNTQSGSVLILRLSDDCLYTAEALDRYLMRIESDKHYRFVGLSMALR